MRAESRPMCLFRPDAAVPGGTSLQNVTYEPRLVKVMGASR